MEKQPYVEALVTKQADKILKLWADEETSPAKRKRPTWLMLIGVPVAIFIGYFLPFLVAEIRNPTSSVDRIKAGCQREFGYLGEEFVSRCVLQLTVRKLNELHQNALDRASR